MEEKIKIIKRQTTYTDDEAKYLLDKFNGDIEKVIMNYHGIDLEKKKREEENKLSTNQKIFRKIGDFF
jgi:hypothetical protein